MELLNILFEFQVFKILSQAPNVTFLNLSRNKLQESASSITEAETSAYFN